MDGAFGGAGEGVVVLRIDDDAADADVPQARRYIEDVDQVRPAGRRVPVGDDDLAIDGRALELARKAGRGAVNPADVARRIGVIAAIGDEADVRGRGHLRMVGREGSSRFMNLPRETMQDVGGRGRETLLTAGPQGIFGRKGARSSRGPWSRCR